MGCRYMLAYERNILRNMAVPADIDASWKTLRDFNCFEIEKERREIFRLDIVLFVIVFPSRKTDAAK